MANTRSKKAVVAASAPDPDAVLTSEPTLDEVRAVLWGIARDPEQAATARVSACSLLLRDARDNDGGESRGIDLNKRALALMRRVQN
jgi:hypothetical protein